MRGTILAMAACGWVVGCDASSSGPPPKKTDVEIHTPGADVKVKGRSDDGSGKKSVDVDVNRR